MATSVCPMTEEIVVVVDEPNAKVVQYQDTPEGRRDSIADSSQANEDKFSFSQGQMELLTRLQAKFLRRA